MDYATLPAGQHPTLLAPIVLGSAIKNPKIVSLAVSALQRLTSIPGAIVEVWRAMLSDRCSIKADDSATLVGHYTNCSAHTSNRTFSRRRNTAQDSANACLSTNWVSQDPWRATRRCKQLHLHHQVRSLTPTGNRHYRSPSAYKSPELASYLRLLRQPCVNW